MMLRQTFLILVTCLCASAATAQFTAEQGVTGGNPASAGQQSDFSNVTTSFDGIDVKVKRLIEDPARDGSLRLILLLTSTAKEDRRLLFVGPATSLIDELGNVYIANHSVGVEICDYPNKWSDDYERCANRSGNLATRLAPGVPVTVALILSPSEGYSAELAKLSTTVSLRSRLAHYSNDLQNGKTADIIVNDIPIPR